MSKVLVDRELLERIAAERLRIEDTERVLNAAAELRPILAQPEDPEGFEIARHSKRLVEQLREQLSAVTAERDRLREDRDSQQRVCIAEMEKANQLRAEVEMLREDAERYRWLRGRLPGSAYRIAGVIYSEGGDGVDAAIDAAMAAREA